MGTTSSGAIDRLGEIGEVGGSTFIILYRVHRRNLYKSKITLLYGYTLTLLGRASLMHALNSGILGSSIMWTNTRTLSASIFIKYVLFTVSLSRKLYHWHNWHLFLSTARIHMRSKQDEFASAKLKRVKGNILHRCRRSFKPVDGGGGVRKLAPIQLFPF